VHDELNESELLDFDEVLALAAELKPIPVWLGTDREILHKSAQDVFVMQGSDGWLARFALVHKFNARIDVLIRATVRASTEIL
jgi:hypothetical protein